MQTLNGLCIPLRLQYRCHVFHLACHISACAESLRYPGALSVPKKIAIADIKFPFLEAALECWMFCENQYKTDLLAYFPTKKMNPDMWNNSSIHQIAAAFRFNLQIFLCQILPVS